MEDFINSETFRVLVVAVPAAIVAYRTYRHAVKVDAVTEKSGVATTQIGSVNQVIEGLESIAKNLREDNAGLRLEISDLRMKHRELISTCDQIKQQLVELNQKIQ